MIHDFKEKSHYSLLTPSYAPTLRKFPLQRNTAIIYLFDGSCPKYTQQETFKKMIYVCA